jgi:hypothetical protein
VATRDFITYIAILAEHRGIDFIMNIEIGIKTLKALGREIAGAKPASISKQKSANYLQFGVVLQIGVLFFLTAACSSHESFMIHDNQEQKHFEVEFRHEPMVALPSSYSKRVTKVAAGHYQSCAIVGGEVICWGASGQPGSSMPELSGAYDIVINHSHACALENKGLRCWGMYLDESTFVPLTSATSLSIGSNQVCFVDRGKAQCLYLPSLTPVSISSVKDPVAVGVGDGVGCILGKSEVSCWGRPENNITKKPQLVDPEKLVVGDTFACVLDQGEVVCWGDNKYGQSEPPLLGEVLDISARGEQVCAIEHDRMKCWGFSETPRVVPLNAPVQVSTGMSHACTLSADGVMCWGGQTDVPYF